MPLMVSIARVTDVTNLSKFAAEHAALFGAFADVPKFLPDPNAPDQVAIVMQVHDLDGLRSVTSSSEGEALKRKLGLLERLSYFIEADT